MDPHDSSPSTTYAMLVMAGLYYVAIWAAKHNVIWTDTEEAGLGYTGTVMS